MYWLLPRLLQYRVYATTAVPSGTDRLDRLIHGSTAVVCYTLTSVRALHAAGEITPPQRWYIESYRGEELV